VHAIILERERGVWDLFFYEMQNGAIWGHFRVSYNIESSTILMTLIDKNFLKLSKICPSCLSRYKHLHYHCFVQVHLEISMNMHQSKGRYPVILHGRPNIIFLTPQYTK
jgi:hypothetical protein